jgi:hypothetical protein
MMLIMDKWKRIAIVLLSIVLGSFGEGQNPAESRDPFWPVGFQKPKPPDPGDEPDSEPEAPIPAANSVWPDLPVQGISRGAGGSYFALIRGSGVVAAGENISVERDDLWYHWKIEHIGSEGIRARKLGVSADRATVPRPASPAGNGQPVKE